MTGDTKDSSKTAADNAGKEVTAEKDAANDSTINDNDLKEEGGEGIDEETGEAVEEGVVTQLQNTLCVKVFGLRRSGKPEEDYAAWCKFFTDDVKVAIPLIQMHGADDLHITFKMHSLEDKRKLFVYAKSHKFQNSKLRVKNILIRSSEVTKEESLLMEKLSVDEGLDILYPHRNVLYADQLSKKFGALKKAVEDNLLPSASIEKFTKNKKYVKSIRPKQIIPLSPTEGYEKQIVIHVEKESENSEVSFGCRATNATKTKTVLLPLEQCLHVPRQIALVAKNIISGLGEVGLDPICPTTGQGSLLGFILNMSNAAQFMLTVIVEKPHEGEFYKLTPEAIVPFEGQTLTESFRSRTKTLITEVQNKLKTFFEKLSASLRITSVYASLAPAALLLTEMEQMVWSNLPQPEFVVGSPNILDMLNSVSIRVDWSRERNSGLYNSLLPAVEQAGFISKTTNVYLMSPVKQLAAYFAKKCAHVTQISYWSLETVNKLRESSKGITNLEFFNLNVKLKKPDPVNNDNTVVICWPFFSPHFRRKNKQLVLLKKFLEFRIYNVVMVNYYNDTKQSERQKEVLEILYSKARVSKVVPFDIEPYREASGLIMAFRGPIPEPIAAPTHPTAGKAPVKKLMGNLNGAPARPPPPRRGLPFNRGGGPGFARGGGPGFNRGGGGGRPGFNRAGPAPPPQRLSVHERLGPRRFDGPSPFETQSRPPQFTEVVEVMNNLQNMAQQMQSILDQRKAMQEQPRGNSGFKRPYPEDDGAYRRSENDWSGKQSYSTAAMVDYRSNRGSGDYREHTDARDNYGGTRESYSGSGGGFGRGDDRYGPSQSYAGSSNRFGTDANNYNSGGSSFDKWASRGSAGSATASLPSLGASGPKRWKADDSAQRSADINPWASQSGSSYSQSSNPWSTSSSQSYYSQGKSYY